MSKTRIRGASVPTSDLEQTLLDRYQKIGLQPPTWSCDYRPSIPFIGTHYKPGGILVYASAENLSGYERNPEYIPAFMKDGRVLNRHRAAHGTGGDFFSNIHIQPFNDGKLIIAIQHYLMKHHHPKVMYRNPKVLLEHIAAANFSKFSIRSIGNRDFAGDMTKLAASMAYVSADLKTLSPAIIIMPRSIWKHQATSALIRQAAPDASVIALPQFTPQVANIHLKHHAVAATRLQASLRGSVIEKWIKKVPGYRAGYFYRFLVELDEAMKG